MTIDQLEFEALKLTERDRERLAHVLIASLEQDDELVRAWYAEMDGIVEDRPAGPLFEEVDDDSLVGSRVGLWP